MATKPTLRERLILCIAAFAATLTFLALWIYTIDPTLSSFSPIDEPLDKTFYDDPKTRYTMDKPMTDWDNKRANWLRNNPNCASENGVIMITGSQPSACKNPTGDHLLLRFFKNKVDYCRIHGFQIYYSNAFLDPKMRSMWTKLPTLRAAMVAHPEAEWLFWVDSDAVFTDMEFEVPLERYKDHNLVVHGWPNMIYEDRSWVAVNSGVFLIRNCQWAMDFLDVWAGMGPRSPNYAEWGRVLRSTLTDLFFPVHGDQSALVYLLLKGDRKWRDRVYIENRYYLHGYWLEVVDKFGSAAAGRRMRRRHAEAVSQGYAAEGRRRPFVTHFTGCQPCGGNHNPAYEGDSCRVGMERALNFADNQVLRSYGFVRPDVDSNKSVVSPLSFDYRG